ncbi:MAG: GGDEF domain-containing protein [Clostridia bacterium]|nr:GGDEF domain-containing protein [Clostridia bacterium]
MRKAQERNPWGQKTGIPMSSVYRVLLIVAALISVALLYAALRVNASFARTQQAMERYITCQQDAVLFEQGSDYLTNESRSFVATGDPAHVLNFVREVEVTRRRESMREDAVYFIKEEEPLRFLDAALNHSNELVQVECYAIRLMIAGMGYDPADFPAMISAVELTEQDAALSPEEQRASAMDRMFNAAYSEKKTTIYEQVERSINALVEDTEQEMMGGAGQLNRLLRRETALIVLLLVLILTTVLLTSFLLIRPLYRNIRHLDKREEMPAEGAREMRHLARVYNDILAENNERNEELSYSANHDALTGLYNRAAYEKAYKAMHKADVGVLVVDIDGFKQFNDSYGHDMGDLVLKRVASVLTGSFRSEDHISRIGGDEFCVIMRHANSALRTLVEEKIGRMNETLSKPDEGTPPISLSVGIAFCDRKNPTDDIFKDADTALYRVKKSGKSGCRIYE